jgi:hypothetical protein
MFMRLKKGGLACPRGKAPKLFCQNAHACADIDTCPISSGELPDFDLFAAGMTDGVKSRQARGERAQTSERGVLNSDLRFRASII